MHKIISSLLLSGMLIVGMVGCKSEKVLQNEIDIFESVSEQEINSESIWKYKDSLDIKDVNVKVILGGECMIFEVLIDKDMYDQFQEDVKEIGLKEAREKYGISELEEAMIIATTEQKNKINKTFKDKECSVTCCILTDEKYDGYNSLVLGVDDGEIYEDKFR